jgi:hypothetical protein
MGWQILPSKPDARPPGKALAAPQHTPQDFLVTVQGTLDLHVGLRMELSAQNLSTSVAVLVLDDGSTAVGSVPAAGKATTMSLTAASVAGGVGGVFSDKFQGRVQVYGSTAGAQAAVYAR